MVRQEKLDFSSGKETTATLVTRAQIFIDEHRSLKTRELVCPEVESEGKFQA
jgi:hypothetical protein